MKSPVKRQISRRDWIRVGALNCLGVSTASIFRTQASAATPAAAGGGGGFGKAKSCIVLYLAGGPPQHDTFDPKPEAPIEIRGQLGSIPTSVPGVHFGELLPLTAKLAHKLTLIRSLNTGLNTHGISGYQILTGHEHPAPTDVPPSNSDWPAIGSMVAGFKPSERFPISSVTLPEPMVGNNGVRGLGQNGGFMGRSWDPFLVQCDPNSADYRVEGVAVSDELPLERLKSRRGLIENLDRRLQSVQTGDLLESMDSARRQAFEVLTTKNVHRAFDLRRESEQLRDRYGRHKFGQSVLLARRLVEAGVRLVQVNFPREPGDRTSPSPVWDTHRENADRLKNNLCPPFDLAYSALLDDLDSCGLLDETLVVVVGEFGRSPKINKFGGRDHWGSCFSAALAGGGIAGGQVIGSSDRHGAYPETRPIRGAEFNATILHRLGIDLRQTIRDPLDRPLPIADALPIRELRG